MFEWRRESEKNKNYFIAVTFHSWNAWYCFNRFSEGRNLFEIFSIILNQLSVDILIFD